MKLEIKNRNITFVEFKRLMLTGLNDEVYSFSSSYIEESIIFLEELNSPVKSILYKNSENYVIKSICEILIKRFFFLVTVYATSYRKFSVCVKSLRNIEYSGYDEIVSRITCDLIFQLKGFSPVVNFPESRIIQMNIRNSEYNSL